MNKIPIAGLLLVCLCACSNKQDLESRLDPLIQQHQLDQAFQTDIPVDSLDIKVKKLGGDLFFSPDLSIDGSIACSTCHHPDRAGADGLSLPVGISVPDPGLVGEARLQAARELYPSLQIQGQIPRHSPSVINSVLYTRALFWDGRIAYAANDKTGDKSIKTGFFGAAQFNPSGYDNPSLLQTQARMPMSSVFEMKGLLAPDYNNHEIEEAILVRLQGSQIWCEKFKLAFASEKSCKETINLSSLGQALAAYQAGFFLVDSPFQRYIEGDKSALSDNAKKGAVLFMTSLEQGGAACISCHSGKHFSDEQFYNLNIPASGQGKNANGLDFGRSNVDPDAGRFSFRTPGLLNIAKTAPYFHNGSVASLYDAIRLHTVNRGDINFTIIENDNIDYVSLNKHIERSYLESGVIDKLPKSLSGEDILAIEAFLKSLTDPCLHDKTCMQDFSHEQIKTYNHQEPLQENPAKASTRKLDLQSYSAPEFSCSPRAIQEQSREKAFQVKEFLFAHKRELGLVKRGWLVDIMNNAGMSVADINYDCLDDVVFDAAKNGIKLYLQQPDGQFRLVPLSPQIEDNALNPLLMDADGDYQYDLFVGTLGKSKAKLVFNVMSENSQEEQVFDTLTGPVINASLADINNDGLVDLGFAFWRSYNSAKQEHLWLADGKGNFYASGKSIELRDSGRTMGGNSEVKRINESGLGSPDLSFTPNFVDIDGDNDEDLLLAADFSRSQVLKNESGIFSDITDKTVINDSNGMGAAIADFDGDGDMDWFVTSVIDEKVSFIDGHKLYINEGDGTFTRKPLPNKKNEWSWGACAADFDNDGDEDIFYISGFAEPMKTAVYETEKQKQSSEIFMANLEKYAFSSPTLLINDGRGNFSDKTEQYGLDIVFDGRGIGCFDYQQDGDIDIVVNPLEGGPVLFENHSGGNWLALRLVGPPGNTEAIGARVVLETDAGKQYRQVRFENNYISRNPSQLHFGLGQQERIRKITIKYPGPMRKEQLITEPSINRLHIINMQDFHGE